MSPQQFTVGVLGHVDHGKTSLVKALTGIETDRLEEEKSRGLSIVLGFAYMESERGIIDFIDAPGHESFIRTMISGATGLDAVLLVVAADEGLKPQTREHISIAHLLGLKQGLIILTKSDIADEDLRDLSRKIDISGDRISTALVSASFIVAGALISRIDLGPKYFGLPLVDPRIRKGIMG